MSFTFNFATRKKFSMCNIAQNNMFKMLVKILILVLFNIITIQACSSQSGGGDETHEPPQVPCAVKLSAYKDATEGIKKSYEEYYGEMEKPEFKSNLPETAEKQHAQFEEQISKVFKEYTIKIDELDHMGNVEKRMQLCITYIEWSKKTTHKLAVQAKEIKEEALDVIGKAEASPEKKESLKKKLNRFLNIIMLLDTAAHIGNELIKVGSWLNNLKNIDKIPYRLLKEDMTKEEALAWLRETEELTSRNNGAQGLRPALRSPQTGRIVQTPNRPGPGYRGGGGGALRFANSAAAASESQSGLITAGVSAGASTGLVSILAPIIGT